MLVRHAMVRGPFCVAPGDRCFDVLRDFRELEIRHAPVMDRGKLVGILSERDLLRALPHLVSAIDTPAGRRDAKALVGSVMATKLITCSPSDPVDVVARTLEENRISCMPVVAREGLVGLVTVNDLLRCFTDHLAAPNARAITLMWSHADDGEAPDVIAMCAANGLRVTTFFESGSDSGAHVYLLRVRGQDAACDALIEQCRAAGMLLMCERAAA